jgi:hypothetical protein
MFQNKSLLERHQTEIKFRDDIRRRINFGYACHSIKKLDPYPMDKRGSFPGGKVVGA